MAIYRSQRTLSRMQYEETFKRLYNDVRDRMSRVPLRRSRYVALPLMRVMNHAYDCILSIAEDPVKGSKNAALVRYMAICKAQEYLIALQKPLYVYWNICCDPDEKLMKYINEKKRSDLSERINDELKLLHAMQKASKCYKPDEDKGDRYVIYYTEKEIHSAQFLTVMQKLHRFTHGKIIRLNRRFRDAEAEMIRKLIDDAWYHAVYGNKIVPANKEQYDWRRKHFSIAISDLYKIQRPIISVFSLNSYSNQEMTDWSGLLNEALRLMQAVQQSDKERFGSLQ